MIPRAPPCQVPHTGGKVRAPETGLEEINGIYPKPPSGQSRWESILGITSEWSVTQDEPRLHIRGNFSSGTSAHRQRVSNRNASIEPDLIPF
jgi:hypothetical protein